FAADQGLRLSGPAVHVAQSSQRRAGQRVEGLAAAGAAIAWLAAGLAARTNVVAAAMWTAEPGDPSLPDLYHQTLVRGGIDRLAEGRRSGGCRAFHGDRRTLRHRMVDRISRSGQSQILKQQASLGSVQQPNPATPSCKCHRVHVRPRFPFAPHPTYHTNQRYNSETNCCTVATMTNACAIHTLACNTGEGVSAQCVRDGLQPVEPVCHHAKQTQKTGENC